MLYTNSMAEVRLTAQRAKFIELYFGPCLFNATEAAKRAGFKHPTVTGSKLKRILAPLMAAKEIELASKLEATGKEVRERLTNISRQDGHKDQLRALELLAKIQGQLTDNIKIKADRSQMEEQLVAALEALKAQGTPSH